MGARAGNSATAPGFQGAKNAVAFHPRNRQHVFPGPPLDPPPGSVLSPLHSPMSDWGSSGRNGAAVWHAETTTATPTQAKSNKRSRPVTGRPVTAIRAPIGPSPFRCEELAVRESSTAAGHGAADLTLTAMIYDSERCHAP